MSTTSDGRCDDCRSGDHSGHSPNMGGICIGCTCSTDATPSPSGPDADTSEREALAEDLAEALHWWNNGGSAGEQGFAHFTASFLQPRGWSRSPRPAPAVEEVNAAERIADEHWITNHRGPRCVACGWWEPHHGEDVSRAARRHVAEVALAVRSDEAAVRVDALRKLAVEYVDAAGQSRLILDEFRRGGDVRSVERTTVENFVGLYSRLEAILDSPAPSPPRPERDVAAEALAAWDTRHDAICDMGGVCSAHRPGFHHPDFDRVAKAEALREAANEAGPALANEVGGHTSTHSVRRWLRDRADSLARSSAGDPTEGGEDQQPGAQWGSYLHYRPSTDRSDTEGGYDRG